MGDRLEPCSTDGRPNHTPVPVTSTIAYFNYTKYASMLAEKIKKAYNDKFLNTSTGEYSTGSQASRLLSFYFGLVPGNYIEIMREALLNKIKQTDYHLFTGFVSTPFY